MTGRFHNATLFSLLIQSRYKVSIELFCVRELANQLSKSTKEGRIIVSTINPGFVATNLMREKASYITCGFNPQRRLCQEPPRKVAEHWFMPRREAKRRMGNTSMIAKLGGAYLQIHATKPR